MEFINITLGEWMDKIAAEYPDQPAVIYTDKFDYRRTYREFNEEIHMTAKAFMALGVKRGDHVAIWATNYPQWMLTLYACAKIGAVLVTVNTAYKINEAEYLLKQSDTKMLVMCDSFKDVSYVEIINRLCPEIESSRDTRDDPRENDVESRGGTSTRTNLMVLAAVLASLFGSHGSGRVSASEYVTFSPGISTACVLNSVLLARYCCEEA
jgi:acyl-CoA synthetase (AMP-forming)/AMP-acid ligase II